jgi:hypothetical protein
LFGGLVVITGEEVREVFLGCENDPRARCFAVLGYKDVEIRQAADLCDAFAQAEMARQTDDEERFRWAEKSAAQGNAMILLPWRLLSIWNWMRGKHRKNKRELFGCCGAWTGT